MTSFTTFELATIELLKAAGYTVLQGNGRGIGRPGQISPRDPNADYDADIDGFWFHLYRETGGVDTSEVGDTLPTEYAAWLAALRHHLKAPADEIVKTTIIVTVLHRAGDGPDTGTSLSVIEAEQSNDRWAVAVNLQSTETVPPIALANELKACGTTEQFFE